METFAHFCRRADIITTVRISWEDADKFHFMYAYIIKRGGQIMSINKNLKIARWLADLTQEEAAEKAGICRTTLSNWENGKGAPDVVSSIALSIAYGTTLDSLLNGPAGRRESAHDSQKIFLYVVHGNKSESSAENSDRQPPTLKVVS